jgi:hypothetical protein
LETFNVNCALLGKKHLDYLLTFIFGDRTMKKMLILMLVLGLASMAQATAWLALHSGSTIAAGNTITIDILADANASGFAIGGMVECVGSQLNTDKQATAVTNKGGAVLARTTPDDGQVFYPGDTLTNPDAQMGYLDNYNGYLTSVAGGYSVPVVNTGDVIAYFKYMISSSWDGSAYYVAPLQADKVYYYNGGNIDPAGTSNVNLYTVLNPIQGLMITPIPEPATIALLCLGGLFLRKKK